MAATKIRKYNAFWPADATDLAVEMACIQHGGKWTKDGRDCGAGLPHHYNAMRGLLWPHLDDHRWSRLCLEEALASKVTVLMGAGSCVAGETRILDPLTGQEPTIEELYENQVEPTVMTMAGPVKAGIPFIRGIEDLYEVILEDGSRFRSTLGHRVLAPEGFVPVSKLRIGSPLIVCGSCLSASMPVSRVVSITRTQQERYFDLTVPVWHHYFSEGCIHHNTGKTHFAAWFSLCDYYCFPNDTCILVSSTDIRGLELRVWGEIKTLHGQAQDRFDVPGYMIDSKHAISTEQIEEASIRDLRKGIIGVPCIQNGKFVGLGKFCMAAGTLVDTPSGPRAIETIQTGDSVISAIGPAQVTATANRTAESLVRVHLKNGQAITCTPDHEFLTALGWVNAIDLQPWTKLFSGHETLQCLREGNTRSRFQQILYVILCRELEKNVSTFPCPAQDCLPLAPRVDRVEVLQPPSADGYPVYNLEVQGHPSYSVAGVIIHNCGIKQKRMRLVADEGQFMGASFLSAFANLDKNVNFRAMVLGNPNDILDPLGKAAEPKEGWGSHLEPEKTSVWDTRFMNGRCVNLIGTDSPNFDDPPGTRTRYPYLISREKIANTLSFFNQDSPEYYSQCIGAMKIGMMLKRVITRDLCTKFSANSRELVWDGPTTKITGLDASYGGDRCITGNIEFGKSLEGTTMLLIHAPVLVPIRLGTGDDPEDQIAVFVKAYCARHSVPPENFFHDSTGRGSLGTALARLWSAKCNPVEFGGSPTSRPVSLDLYIWDQEKKMRRLKRCDEHYSKFVTELWFTVRYAIEAGQVRGLPEDVMEEFCMREWTKVKGDKIEIERKEDMKARVGRSPDLADWAAICFEGARQRGFQISRLANAEMERTNRDWIKTLERKANTHQTANLVYA